MNLPAMKKRKVVIAKIIQISKADFKKIIYGRNELYEDLKNS